MCVCVLVSFRVRRISLLLWLPLQSISSSGYCVCRDGFCAPAKLVQLFRSVSFWLAEVILKVGPVCYCSPSRMGISLDPHLYHLHAAGVSFQREIVYQDKVVFDAGLRVIINDVLRWGPASGGREYRSRLPCQSVMLLTSTLHQSVISSGTYGSVRL